MKKLFTLLTGGWWKSTPRQGQVSFYWNVIHNAAAASVGTLCRDVPQERKNQHPDLILYHKFIGIRKWHYLQSTVLSPHGVITTAASVLAGFTLNS